MRLPLQSSLGACLILVLASAQAHGEVAEVAPKPAEYLVRMLPGAAPKLAVTASLPIRGQTLARQQNRCHPRDQEARYGEAGIDAADSVCQI
jgi:hypothetical protein